MHTGLRALPVSQVSAVESTLVSCLLLSSSHLDPYPKLLQIMGFPSPAFSFLITLLFWLCVLLAPLSWSPLPLSSSPCPLHGPVQSAVCIQLVAFSTLDSSRWLCLSSLSYLQLKLSPQPYLGVVMLSVYIVSFCLYLPSNYQCFYVDAEDLNSGPHACAAGTLPT